MSAEENTLKLISDSLNIESHYQLLNWLQSDLQSHIPHDILIAAWGDFSLNIMFLDVVAIHPLVRTSNMDKQLLIPQIKSLLSIWADSGMKPIAINIEDGFLDIHNAIKSQVLGTSDDSNNIKEINKMTACLLHGIKDNRSHDDCLYLFLSNQSVATETKSKLPIFLPFIDNAFRRIMPLNTENIDSLIDNESLNPNLSDRECEIMNYVKDGKTNSEIAQILDISQFTVKNHLQRIFKKLNANNRSQATFKYKTLNEK